VTASVRGSRPVHGASSAPATSAIAVVCVNLVTTDE